MNCSILQFLDLYLKEILKYSHAFIKDLKMYSPNY